MLADLGAEVVKIEPPGGDVTRRRGPFPQGEAEPEKSGLFIYLNANKRGVVADLKRSEGREMLGRMLERADVLFHNVPPAERAAHGLDSSALCAAHPKLIVTSVSIYGDRGPHANWRGYELNASNAGGWAYLSPGASPYPELPPLKCFGSQGDFQGGVHAAIATLAAYVHRIKSGKGQAIDVSEQECVAGILEITVEEDQWKRLVELMGNPEWANDDLFKDRLLRGQNMDALKALMSEWLAGWKVQDLYREAQKRRIPFAPVNTMQQLSENEHLSERKFFELLEQPGMGTIKVPGMPSRYARTPWALRRPAPRLGEHNEEIFV